MGRAKFYPLLEDIESPITLTKAQFSGKGIKKLGIDGHNLLYRLTEKSLKEAYVRVQ